MASELVETWRKIIVGREKSWVLFENGTIVILTKPEEDLKNQAISLMKEFGIVWAGTPAGDFSVIDLSNDDGFAVTFLLPFFLPFVTSSEV